MQLGWPELVALLTSFGFGVLSAIVPIASGEAYVIASQVTAVAGPLPIAVGVGLGQSLGKVLIFLAIRHGRDIWFVRRAKHTVPAPATAEPPATAWRFRTWLRRFLARLLELVGTNRWGLPIVLLAAVIGLPPLYAVTLIAGASTMRALWFGVIVAVGRVARFVLVALGIAGLPF